MEITFNNLTGGYLDLSGLFVPLTNLELANGKPDLPKDVKLVVRGDVHVGPYDAAGDGIQDSNSDGRADDPNDATSQQYLIPNASLLLNNVHYYVRQADALIGGSTSVLSSANGQPLPDPVVSVATTLPGMTIRSQGVPAYWYLLITPVGGGGMLIPGSVLEVGVNPRLPYTAVLGSKSTTVQLENL
jgi:hypothetical protein